MPPCLCPRGKDSSFTRSQQTYLLIRRSSPALVSKVNWDQLVVCTSSSTGQGTNNSTPDTGQNVRVLSSQFGDL